MRNKNLFRITILSFLLATSVIAQAQIGAETDSQEKLTELKFNLKNEPKGFDNYSYMMVYFNENKVYNVGNVEVCSVRGTVLDLAMNPTGASFAVIGLKDNSTIVYIYEANVEDKLITRLKDEGFVTTMAYAPDSKKLVLANVENKLRILETRDYTLVSEIDAPLAAQQIAISANNYYLAAVSNSNVVIWNFETNEIRKELVMEQNVNSISFSEDSNSMALLLSDGTMTIYDTKTFLPINTYTGLDDAIACKFHPEGKYMLVLTADNNIAVFNLIDSTERTDYTNINGNTTDISIIQDYVDASKCYMLYNDLTSLNVKQLGQISPFYGKLMAGELDARMNTWLQMMDGESLDEYNDRVNDDTRMQQMQLIERDIATRMADSLLDKSDVSTGSYNLESNVLTLEFSTMPAIFLAVPEADVNDFMDVNDLEFTNVVYALTDDDKFEIIYADVYNKKGDKSYVYDNLDRASLSYLESEDDFVSLELIQQSNMDKIKLEEIKEEVVNVAKSENVISDNTTISVNANVVLDTDANGEKITNYILEFKYSVSKEYSTKEDFKPGKYKIEESGAATSMSEIIKKVLEGEFSQYVAEGKKLKIKITGNADALAIVGKIPYDGCYGEYKAEPIYKNGVLTTVSVNKREGVTQNEQLAFLRACCIRESLNKNVPSLSEMDVEFIHYIELLEGKGGEFRRIKVEFTFVDAF